MCMYVTYEFIYSMTCLPLARPSRPTPSRKIGAVVEKVRAFMASDKAPPGASVEMTRAAFSARSTELASHKVASSLMLQQLLYYNTLYSFGWLLASFGHRNYEVRPWCNPWMFASSSGIQPLTL